MKTMNSYIRLGLIIVMFNASLPGMSSGQNPAVPSTDLAAAEQAIHDLISRPIVSFQSIRQVKEQFGSTGADALVKLFKNTFNNTQRTFLMIMLRYFEDQGRHQFPFVFNYLLEQEGKEMIEDEFITFLNAFDTAAFLDPEEPAYFDYLTHAIDRNYWTEDNTPKVLTFDYGQMKIVYMDNVRIKTRIRKHVANAFSIIGDEHSLRILEHWAELEEESGDKQFAWVLSGTVSYIRDYGEIRTLILEKDYLMGPFSKAAHSAKYN